MIKRASSVIPVWNIKSVMLSWTASPPTCNKKASKSRTYSGEWMNIYISPWPNYTKPLMLKTSHMGYATRITVTCENNHSPGITPTTCELFHGKNIERIPYESVIFRVKYQVSACINGNGSESIPSYQPLLYLQLYWYQKLHENILPRIEW